MRMAMNIIQEDQIQSAVESLLKRTHHVEVTISGLEDKAEESSRSVKANDNF